MDIRYQLDRYFLPKTIHIVPSPNEDKNENDDFFYEITLSLSLKEIKTSTFNLRLNGIKDLDDFIEKNKKNKNMREKIIELIKKNDIIQEIFGPNYHSQIINKSKEIVKLLLLENQLSKEEIELIWNCTKRGDLEAKVTILKLLSELADNLKEDYVEMLLNNIKSTTDGKKPNTKTPGASGANRGKSSASTDSGKIYGNGSKNPILGYAITKGSGGFIETAQMK